MLSLSPGAGPQNEGLQLINVTICCKVEIDSTVISAILSNSPISEVSLSSSTKMNTLWACSGNYYNAYEAPGPGH